MKELIESLTEAFIGESQARNRYTIYAKVAKKEGYEKIARRLRSIAILNTILKASNTAAMCNE